ncbi:hypothetical protein SAMN05216338_106241 [Bradyrhizobium sp. Rc2d]|uniref:hypothetical protein n=1 Tax=Bradyrhizobium sp. Rc2d TaxID=1855321 RepID=UPI000883E65D|nr:hypothetical protein [Bradyrhizobium sp. Rc2d]SDJ72879.1 hypothetical protein SAMN05216338_106241 [Bradyrhizobium sp. Rc2d]
MKKPKIRSQPPEPPFGLDMPFDEALKRFIGTDPKEVQANIDKSKKKKPPGTKPDGKNLQQENVVSLRSRRMRKRNDGR